MHIPCTQARCFAHFTSIFDELINRDKSEARYDDGVVDIRANAITLKKEVPFYTDQVTSQRAKLYTLELDRGLEWPKVRRVSTVSTVSTVSAVSTVSTVSTVSAA